MDRAEACMRESEGGGGSSKTISSREVTPSAAHISSSHNQLYCLHALVYLTSPHLTSPHLTSPHLTSPHLTSSHLTSSHLTSPLTPRPSFSSRFPLLSSYKIGYFCSANSVHRRGRVASGPGGGMLKQMMLSEERQRSGPGSNKVMTWHL